MQRIYMEIIGGLHASFENMPFSSNYRKRAVSNANLKAFETALCNFTINYSQIS